MNALHTDTRMHTKAYEYAVYTQTMHAHTTHRHMCLLPQETNVCSAYLATAVSFTLTAAVSHVC